MNVFIFTLLAALVLAASPAGAVGERAVSPRTVLPFDNDWRFLKGDAKAAEKLVFNDSQWRLLNVPHDWSIEGPFLEKNPTTGAGGFLPAGVGW